MRVSTCQFQTLVISLWLLVYAQSFAEFFVEGSDHDTGDTSPLSDDVNGDGRPDVVVGGEAPNPVELNPAYNTTMIGGDLKN